MYLDKFKWSKTMDLILKIIIIIIIIIKTYYKIKISTSFTGVD